MKKLKYVFKSIYDNIENLVMILWSISPLLLVIYKEHIFELIKKIDRTIEYIPINIFIIKNTLHSVIFTILINYDLIEGVLIIALIILFLAYIIKSKNTISKDRLYKFSLSIHGLIWILFITGSIHIYYDIEIGIVSKFAGPIIFYICLYFIEDFLKKNKYSILMFAVGIFFIILLIGLIPNQEYLLSITSLVISAIPA